jgi:hypothetical protein
VPDNHCEGKMLGFVRVEGSDDGCADDDASPLDVVLGIVVFWADAFCAVDWSTVIEGGVWMAFVSDESADEG